VVKRIFGSLGLTDKFPKACQQQLQDILSMDPCQDVVQDNNNSDNNNDENVDDKDHDGIETGMGWVKVVRVKQPTKKQSYGSSSSTNNNNNNYHPTKVQLKDLTHLPYITIDNDHSMDLDQAMYICKTKCPPQHNDFDNPSWLLGKESFHESFVTKNQNDNTKIATLECDDDENEDDDENYSYLVSYALADGAYFVPAFSPLFEHALYRGGASFYLPGKSIPMLPRELSEHVMSLNEGVPRRALVFDMYLDQHGHVLRSFYRYAIIQSRWKGTYREVSEYYHAMDSHQHHWIAQDNMPYQETIDLLRQVGQLRINLAKHRNVVQYHRDNGEVVTIDPHTGKLTFQPHVSRYSSELYNEQISVLCNMEGAKMLSFLDDLEAKTTLDVLHPIYRTQRSPREDQTKTLEEVITNTLQMHGLDVSRWGWQSQPVGDVPESPPSEDLASYLERIRTHAESIDGDQQPHGKQKWKRVIMVIDRQAQMTNQAASFSITPNDGHHALKTTHYARFSSPMRELVGCFTHKELLEAHIGRFSHENLSPKKDMECKYWF
jgi:exoribonuclease R